MPPHPSPVGPQELGPPPRWVPGCAAAAAVLGSTDTVALALTSVRAYPTGFLAEIQLRARVPLTGRGHGGMLDGLLVAVSFADGSAAAADSAPPPGSDLRMVMRGGGGGQFSDGTGSWGQDAWISPLPPPGPVTFTVAWPDHGLAETDTVLDAAEILDAASRATALWDGQVLPDVVDFPGAPPLPPPGHRQPEQPEAAEEEVRAAFAQALTASGDPEFTVDAVQDGRSLLGSVAQLGRNYARAAATARVAVGSVVFIDEVRAAAVFRVLYSGGMQFGAQLGYAVLVDGRWLVARDTYCMVLGWGGVGCPPPRPPRP